jgi:hypothetical protein
LKFKPEHLKCPGGKVFLVAQGGSIGASFTVHKILGPTTIKLAGGEVRSGFRLVAKRGSLLFYPPGERSCPVQWHAIGEIRYLDPDTGVVVRVGINTSRSNYLPDSPAPPLSKATIRTVPYRGGIPGLERGNPESLLVDEYVAWLNDPEKFEHDALERNDLFTDLFDRSQWRLIEAKVKTDRMTLRTALGQLLDYKRFYARKPSLGVLLPHRPDPKSLDYLTECRVTVIWKAGREFQDSSEGGLDEAEEGPRINPARSFRRHQDAD